MTQTIYHLWSQDDYVEINGRTEPPVLIGTFSSLDKLNDFAQEFWFQLQVDIRGRRFTPDVMKFIGSGAQDGSVYVECCELDPVRLK